MNLLPFYPGGWYALASSKEIGPGELVNQRFMNQEVVLFRTESGEICLMDAYCPHLGAHMGYGGRVNGEFIQCPFHRFEFNVSGACSSIPYGTRIPPKANARVFPTAEKNGLILAYFNRDGVAPDWSIPDMDMHGWLPLRTRQWDFRGHPQETTENSVDLGHFAEVHGYKEIAILREPVTEGPYLTNRYRMIRENSFLGRSVTIDITLHVHGLGYSLVEVHVLEFDLHSRMFVLATPTQGENIRLRIALSMNAGTDLAKIHPLLRFLPHSLVNAILARQMLDGFAHDVQQDIPIWQHKRYVQPPILAAGDGPIGVYRQWAKQFYPIEERKNI